MKKEVLFDVNCLTKYFGTGKKKMTALDRVSFQVYKGETLGIVGESGCGKTTCGRTCIGLYDKDGGAVLYKGKEVHAMSKKEYYGFTSQVQTVFQDPYASLNPRMKVLDIVAEGLDIHHLVRSRKEREERVIELLETVGLSKEHAGRYIHEFSGGQRQRIGIARALAVDPECLLCDEAVSALDVSVQAQIMNLLVELQEKKKLTYLFISHDLSVVRFISDRIIVMYFGKIVESGDTKEIFENTLHPYTKILLSAIPILDPEKERERMNNLKDQENVNKTGNMTGCRFCARCPMVKEICRQKDPALKEVAEGHCVACHFA